MDYQTQLAAHLPYFNRSDEPDSKVRRRANRDRSKLIFLKASQRMWEDHDSPVQVQTGATVNSEAIGSGLRLKSFDLSSLPRHKHHFVIPYVAGTWKKSEKPTGIVSFAEPVEVAISKGLVTKRDFFIPAAEQRSADDPNRDLEKKAELVHEEFKKLREVTPLEWVRRLDFLSDTTGERRKILVWRIAKMVWWDFVVSWEDDCPEEIQRHVDAPLPDEHYNVHTKAELSLALWEIGYPAYYAYSRVLSV